MNSPNFDYTFAIYTVVSHAIALFSQASNVEIQIKRWIIFEKYVQLRTTQICSLKPTCNN